MDLFFIVTLTIATLLFSIVFSLLCLLQLKENISKALREKHRDRLNNFGILTANKHQFRLDKPVVRRSSRSEHNEMYGRYVKQVTQQVTRRVQTPHKLFFESMLTATERILIYSHVSQSFAGR